MRKLLPAGFLLLLFSNISLASNDTTWIEINGQTYGAKPNSQGPIGGGSGYTQTITEGDYYVEDLDSLLDALSKATHGEIVFIPDEIEIDLTTRVYIEQLSLHIPEGVTLAGNRGNGNSKGAMLFSDALKTPVLISADGPNVRITGLRIKGPNAKRYLDHHRRSFGNNGDGHNYYYQFPTSAGIVTQHNNLEVDNCEISAFSHGSTYLISGQDHHIHHNFIHHCQYDGLGYGVVHGTAKSLIEYNLFNWNRHSIAGTGLPGDSYIARNNVELGVSLSHCFDMHGGHARKDGTNTAGTRIEIYNNTFSALETPIYIGGEPEESCMISNNWFQQHSGPEQAVKAFSKTTIKDNAYGISPADSL
ncbi:hypothetical protein [Parendozoicomonas haliclonae]|uniref:hypothetical protein n=1 Tax=Parendozoicomonas haliclonae TaxID=1960125 RepID=UPI0010541636|nr:hypothetical protein [Parendozoicomonas haliclonae]